MSTFKNPKMIIILSWTAVLLWLVLIFYLSAQPAEQSDGLSKKMTEVIIETVDRVVPLDTDGKPTIRLFGVKSKKKGVTL